jgi:hypothetical protein
MSQPTVSIFGTNPGTFENIITAADNLAVGDGQFLKIWNDKFFKS